MTIREDFIPLWDDGVIKFQAVVMPNGQYQYIDGRPCITVGFAFENQTFKGFDRFTLFDTYYTDLLEEMEKIWHCLNGRIRLYDMGADTDGYIDISASNGRLAVSGQLGATFSDFSLKFSFDADQTLLGLLRDCLK